MSWKSHKDHRSTAPGLAQKQPQDSPVPESGVQTWSSTGLGTMGSLFRAQHLWGGTFFYFQSKSPAQLLPVPRVVLMPQQSSARPDLLPIPKNPPCFPRSGISCSSPGAAVQSGCTPNPQPQGPPHRTPEGLGLDGISGDPPCQGRATRSSDTGTHPGGFGTAAERRIQSFPLPGGPGHGQSSRMPDHTALIP